MQVSWYMQNINAHLKLKQPPNIVSSIWSKNFLDIKTRHVQLKQKCGNLNIPILTTLICGYIRIYILFSVNFILKNKKIHNKAKLKIHQLNLSTMFSCHWFIFPAFQTFCLNIIAIEFNITVKKSTYYSKSSREKRSNIFNLNK